MNSTKGAAKAGVIGLAWSLAYEVAADGITVNAICPGPVDTELFRNIPEACPMQVPARNGLGDRVSHPANCCIQSNFNLA